MTKTYQTPMLWLMAPFPTSFSILLSFTSFSLQSTLASWPRLLPDYISCSSCLCTICLSSPSQLVERCSRDNFLTSLSKRVSHINPIPCSGAVFFFRAVTPSWNIKCLCVLFLSSHLKCMSGGTMSCLLVCPQHPEQCLTSRRYSG